MSDPHSIKKTKLDAAIAPLVLTEMSPNPAFFKKLSIFIAIFSVVLVFAAMISDNGAMGESLLLISGTAVMGLAVGALYYAQSGKIVKIVAVSAITLAVFSQSVNILDEFSIIQSIPILNNSQYLGDIKQIAIVLGLLLFIVALYLAVVEFGVAKTRLRTERNFFDRVMQGTSTLICVVKSDGTIAYINQAVLETLDQKAEDLIGKDWWDSFSAIPLSDPQRTLDLFATQDVHDHVLTLQNREKVKRHISWSSNNRYDVDGKLIESFRFGADITQRKAFEEDRDRLATAIEQSFELVAITNAYGLIQYVNTTFLNVTGYNREEILGKPLHELRKDQYTPELYETMRETLLSGEVWHARIHHTAPENRELELNVTASPINGTNGKLKGFVVTYRDVTHEVELEAQLRQAQKMQAIGTLAGGVAHDFNNILSPIIGYTEMAMHEVEREGVTYKYLVNIMDAGMRAKNLVRQILTFSSQADQELKPIRLAPILREAMKLVRGSMPGSIEIHEQLNANCPPVLADPTKMHQVMINLCTNAFHAMEENGGELTVSLKLERVSSTQAESKHGLKPGDYCCLTVADTGTGIEEHLQDRIFEPYFTTKTDGRGFGLGLATVHGIVQAHGGIILVDSIIGVGTTVRLYLPVIKDAIPAESAIEENIFEGNGEKILLVDDEFPVLQVTKRILNRLAYEVIACSSPLEALDIFKKAPNEFDLVLTDLSMPKMNGIHLAVAIHEVRMDIPVLLVTGFNSQEVQEEAIKAGIAAIAAKPLTPQELGALIHNSLKNKAIATHE